MKPNFQAVENPHHFSRSSLVSPRSPNYVKNSVLTLLKACKVSSNELSKIEGLQNDREIINHLVLLLKPIFEGLLEQNSTLSSEGQKHKTQTLKLSQRISQLSQICNQQKLKETSLNLSIQNIQKHCDQLNQKFLRSRREYQQMDDNLFKKSKECANLSHQIRVLNQQIQILSKKLQSSISKSLQKDKDLQRAISNFKIQRLRIFKTLQIRQEQIEALMIQNHLSEEQYQKIEREYLRWRERYFTDKHQISSSKNNQYTKQGEKGCSQERVANLVERINSLSEKLKIANEQKMRLYQQLQQIKQLLLLHGIQYDKFEDAHLIQLVRKQKQNPKTHTKVSSHSNQYHNRKQHQQY